MNNLNLLSLSVSDVFRGSFEGGILRKVHNGESSPRTEWGPTEADGCLTNNPLTLCSTGLYRLE